MRFMWLTFWLIGTVIWILAMFQVIADTAVPPSLVGWPIVVIDGLWLLLPPALVYLFGVGIGRLVRPSARAPSHMRP